MGVVVVVSSDGWSVCGAWCVVVVVGRVYWGSVVGLAVLAVEVDGCLVGLAPRVLSVAVTFTFLRLLSPSCGGSTRTQFVEDKQCVAADGDAERVEERGVLA